ncbi:OmpA family protein [Dongia deserti]|uniref:OmpA family protein n=1 Tax=Dongia deserti TaxID=2268030 RepID=UPI000E64CA2A|nr:OmpA family protein [Dongia deserti]
MTRGVKLASLGASLLALAACAVPDRQPDLDNIAANVEQTREGDFGEFLYNLNEAGDKARRAEEIHDEVSQVPPYLHASLSAREEGVRLAEESAEHRRRAEDALNRILDPLRARIAYLESLHVPQTVGALTRAVYFDTGSAALGDDDQPVLDEVSGFLSQYPIATVVITGYADTQGSLEANRALAQRRAQAVAQALRGLGGPLAGSVSVVAVGEPEGAADSEANPEDRRVEILVAPHGTYNQGP